MTGRCTKPTVVVLARQDEFDGFVTRQGIWPTKQMQRSQSPVDTIESQMLCEPIFKLVSSLAMHQYSAGRGDELTPTHCVKALDILYMSVRDKGHLSGQVTASSART